MMYVTYFVCNYDVTRLHHSPDFSLEWKINAGDEIQHSHPQLHRTQSLPPSLHPPHLHGHISPLGLSLGVTCLLNIVTDSSFPELFKECLDVALMALGQSGEGAQLGLGDPGDLLQPN